MYEGNGMYNQYSKNEMDGRVIWPKFEQGLQFYVPIGAIFVELDYSNTKEKHESELALLVVLLQ